MSDALDLERAAREAGEREAWIDEAGPLTSEALAGAAREAAARWPALSPGDRVLITPRLDRESALALLALLDARATVVLAHPRWSEAERAAVAQRTRPRLVLDGGRPLLWGEPSDSSRDGPRRDVSRPPASSREREGEAMGERELADPCAPAVIVFTSGTSGVPKGVCLSRAALVAATAAHAAALPWTERDRWLLAMPLAHVGGLLVVLRCLAARRAVVLGPDRFEPRALLEVAARGEATLMSLVPAMLERLLPAPPPPSVRAVLLGGAACPPELLARGRAAGWPLLPTYGLSECTAQVCTQRLGGERARGVGPPLPGIEVRVREGVIEVRGPTRMDGYLDEPPLAREEWVRTGDLGALDEEGHLHVFGRADDVIVTGGENVDPLAVEEALRAHPEVDAACVVGVDDVRWGQAVVALIVARDPASPPSDEALRSHLEARVASYARPRRWVFVDSLPLNASGKLDRRAARERARA